MKKLICRLLGHRYKYKRMITDAIHEMECTRCKEEFGVNTDKRTVLRMDDELREIHEYLLVGGPMPEKLFVKLVNRLMEKRGLSKTTTS